MRKHTRRMLGIMWLSFMTFTFITMHHLVATEMFMKPHEAHRSWFPTAGNADGFRQSWLPRTGQVQAVLSPLLAPGQHGTGQGWRSDLRTSLVVQLLRIHLACRGHGFDLMPSSGRFLMPWGNWACALHLLKPVCLESVLHNKRSHHNEKHTAHVQQWRVAPACCN